MCNLDLLERRKRLFQEVGLPVNATSLEIAKRLKDTTDRLNNTMSKLTNVQNQLIESQCKNADNERLIEDLKARLAKYEVVDSVQAKIHDIQAQGQSEESTTKEPKASAKIVPTSNNSSVPPSKNPIGIKHTQSLRPKSNKKPGGQFGHKGKTYDIPTESCITSEQRWYPVGGLDTHKDCFEGPCRYVVDIPTSVFLDITKHIVMCRREINGNIVKGEFPKGVNSYMSYGPNFQSFIVYLNTYLNIPLNKLRELIKAMFGFTINNGTIVNIVNKMRKLSKRTYDKIRESVANSKVVGADESGVNVNGENYWLWAFQTTDATFLAIDKRRSREVIKRLFEDKELEHMILESDRWGSYFTDDIKVKNHQLCLAHLLRNLIYCTEAFPEEPWSMDMIELLRESIHRRKTEGVSKELYTEMCNRLNELLDKNFVYEPQSKEEENTMYKLRESLRKYRNYIFTFLIQPEVRYTNNDSEKAVRPMKTKLKVCGCFRKERGAENYAIFGSIIQTAIKNLKNPFEALQLIAKSAYEE